MTANLGRTIAVVLMALSFATAGMTASDEKIEEATVTGTVNKIDAAKSMINITHGPVPSIGWPEMTMDIPVTKRVDLSKVETGKPVEFTLKQGRDKTYRVIAIEAK